MMKQLLSIFLFISLVSSAQVVVLEEGFESGIPAAWTLIKNDNNTPATPVQEYSAAWIIKQDTDNTSDSTASSTSYFNPAGTADRWLITPAMTLGSFGNFASWRAKSHDASFPDDYTVLVSTTGTTMSSFTDTIGLIFQENESWTERNINMQSYANQTVYLAFVLTTNDGFKLYLDDVKMVKEDPVGMAEKNLASFELINLGERKFFVQSEQVIEKIEVLNQLGEVVLTGAKSSFNLSTTTNQMVFVRVYTPTGIVVKKLMVY